MSDLMTIREYAKSIGVSYESVRKKVRQYESELEGHITVNHRTTFIDEFAMDFLNEHRRVDTVQIFERSEEEKELLRKLSEAQEQVISLQNVIISLTDEKNGLLLDIAESKRILSDQERLKEDLSRKEEESNALEAEIIVLKEENKTLTTILEEMKDKKRWWQFWK